MVQAALVRVDIIVRDLYAREHRIGGHNGFAVRPFQMPDDPPVRLRRGGAAGAGVLFFFHDIAMHLL